MLASVRTCLRIARTSRTRNSNTTSKWKVATESSNSDLYSLHQCDRNTLLPVKGLGLIIFRFTSPD